MELFKFSENAFLLDLLQRNYLFSALIRCNTFGLPATTYCHDNQGLLTTRKGRQKIYKNGFKRDTIKIYIIQRRYIIYIITY